jgi:hypothetical protein
MGTHFWRLTPHPFPRAGIVCARCGLYRDEHPRFWVWAKHWWPTAVLVAGLLVFLGALSMSSEAFPTGGFSPPKSTVEPTVPVAAPRPPQLTPGPLRPRADGALP